MQKRHLVGVALAAGALVLAGCGTGSSDTNGAGKSEHGIVHISGQNFPEAQIMAEIYATVLRANGYTPSLELVGDRNIYMQTFPDSIDVVPEYVSGIVDYLMLQDDPKAKLPTSSDPNTVISDGKSQLDKAGITLLNPSEAADANAFFVTKKYSDANNVTTLSDLKGKSVVLAAAPDCKGRLDCAQGLEDDYGINITKILPLGFASQQTYNSVKTDESQLGETSTTDPNAAHENLVILTDDKHIQPAQNLVPAIGSDFLKANPDVADILNKVMAQMTTRALTQLNFDVTVNRQSPAVVAQDWVQGNR
jgi:osmoprotectant transport system substrate-binding protein